MERGGICSELTGPKSNTHRQHSCCTFHLVGWPDLVSTVETVAISDGKLTPIFVPTAPVLLRLGFKVAHKRKIAKINFSSTKGIQVVDIFSGTTAIPHEAFYRPLVCQYVVTRCSSGISMKTHISASVSPSKTCINYP